MKFSPVRGILDRSLINKDRGDTINILTCCAHDPFEAGLCRAIPNAHFYAYNDEHVINGWAGHRTQPLNYTVLPRGSKDAGIPQVPFHLCLSHNPFAHIQYLTRYSQLMGIPLISIAHTNPPLGGHPSQWQWLHNIDAEHVFITDNNRLQWGFGDHPRAHTIYHQAELDVFKPLDLPRENYIVTVGNEISERWRELGLDLQQQVTQGLPTRHIGKDSHNPQLNNPVMGAQNLNIELNKARIFGCFAKSSPIPMSLIEACAAGCAILTTNNSAIPDIFRHKENCMMFSVDRPDIGRQHLEFLLNNPAECERLGRNARKLAEDFFSPRRFAEQWENLLWTTIKKV